MRIALLLHDQTILDQSGFLQKEQLVMAQEKSFATAQVAFQAASSREAANCGVRLGELGPDLPSHQRERLSVRSRRLDLATIIVERKSRHLADLARAAARMHAFQPKPADVALKGKQRGIRQQRMRTNPSVNALLDYAWRRDEVDLIDKRADYVL